MILSCSKCKASYLVPATVFSGGPRTVRCARCAHTWLADLPAGMVVMPQSSPSQNAAAPVSPPLKRERAPESRNTPETDQDDLPFSPPFEDNGHSPFSASNLPAIWRNPLWKKIRLVLFMTAGLGALWALGDAVINGPLGETLSSRMERFIKDAGLVTPPAGEGLSLEQIRSERRFEDGGLHLVVDGEVRNTTHQTLSVPDILVKAIGPDKQVVQSWRIEAPAATLPPGAMAPFHSSIVSPEGAVVEINMSFAEREHE